MHFSGQISFDVSDHLIHESLAIVAKEMIVTKVRETTVDDELKLVHANLMEHKLPIFVPCCQIQPLRAGISQADFSSLIRRINVSFQELSLPATFKCN